MNTVSILFAQLVSSEEDMAKYDTFYSKCNDRFDALCDLKEKKTKWSATNLTIVRRGSITQWYRWSL